MSDEKFFWLVVTLSGVFGIAGVFLKFLPLMFLGGVFPALAYRFQERKQFSLRALLIATTVLAIQLGLSVLLVR